MPSLTLLLAILLLLNSTLPSHAAASKADTAFMIFSTVLVLLMTLPGLALFYAGLVRTKNVVSVLMHVFTTVCLVCILWLIYGYSLAFTGGGQYGSFIGGWSKVMLSGVSVTSEVATFSNGVTIPEFVYVWFQMTFAAITAALIVGAFAERIKFQALLLFVVLWTTLVYCPIAHMVWYWPGPDALASAARDVAASAGLAKLDAQARLDALIAESGLLYRWGAIDFAGGTVVHVNAGIAGLVGALILGPRTGYGREAMPPHSLVLSMVGACLLWVGWFGFNCGSNLEANGTAALAMGNTFVATAAAALGWIATEWVVSGKPRILGATTGAIAGLVAVTPASGFAGPAGALALGLVVSPICYAFCTSIKSALGYDDTLDVFGVHGIAGIVGALGTGIVVNPAFGGTGVADYVVKPGDVVFAYDMATQMTAQVKAVAVTILWSGGVSAVIFWLLALTIGLRRNDDAQRLGLDIAEHGERGYNY
jgi:Amt family ammonium transporter